MCSRTSTTTSAATRHGTRSGCARAWATDRGILSVQARRPTCDRPVQSAQPMPPTHLAMAREVEQFRQQFEQIAQDADALVNPLSDEQFVWQPRPASWSVAQCIEHLNT